MSTIKHTPLHSHALPASALPKGALSVDEGAEKCPDRVEIKDPDGEKAEDLHNGATVSANLIDHLKDSPLFEKLSGLVAGALVISGVKKIYCGIKEKDRPQFLEGSKQTMWGTYCGLTAIDTVFKTAMSLTPFMRSVGGFFAADLGITALCKDLKGKEKVDTDRAIFHGSAATWGLRHVAMGIGGLSKTRWAAGLIEKASPAIKALFTTPVFGAVGMALGAAGGALDTVLGARLLTRGIKTGDKEKKVLGTLDLGTGIAMGRLLPPYGTSGHGGHRPGIPRRRVPHMAHR